MGHDEFCADFDAMFVELARRARTGRFQPNCDVFLSDDGETLVVDVELAGAEPADLRVGIEERYLFILGRRVRRERSGRDSVLMKEIEYGDFVKKIRLPVPIDTADATASYKDGMLTIRLPVSRTAAIPRHRTEIQMTVQRILV